MINAEVHLEEFFTPDDEPAFVQLTTGHLQKGAAAKRGITRGEYVSLARGVWASCETDDVYAVKLLIDPQVAEDSASFPQEYTSSGKPFCALVARIDNSGGLVDAPQGYNPPSFPAVYLAHVVIGSNSEGTSPDPSTPGDYIFAFLDVLGFEALLTSIGLAELIRRYEQLLAEALVPQSEAHPWSLASTTVAGELAPGLMWLPIQTAYFSDSLLLWVNYNPAHVEEFLNRVASVFCQALALGLPIRGAISVGTSRLDKENGIFLGAPLVEAVRLESKSDWIGISLCASWKRETHPIPVPPDSVFVYTPPLKEGGAALFSGLVLDWPRVWRESRHEAATKYLEELRTPELPAHLKARYDAAVTFYEYSAANQNWGLPAGWTRIKPKDLLTPKGAQ